MTVDEYLEAVASVDADASTSVDASSDLLLGDLIAQHEAYSLATIFFICALLGCVLAAYVWRGD